MPTKKKTHFTITEAAKQLGVSRAALHALGTPIVTNFTRLSLTTHGSATIALPISAFFRL